MSNLSQKAKVLTLALMLVAAFGFSAQVSAEDSEGLKYAEALSKVYENVAKKVTPAVVFINVEQTLETSGEVESPFDLFEDDFFKRFFPRRQWHRRIPRKYKRRGQGSGFIISADGYILTNNHVVADADKIKVKLTDGREFAAKRIGTDPGSDVALIKIDAKKLPFLKLGDSDRISVGQPVAAVGNPLGLTSTFTTGVISAKGRNAVGLLEFEDFIQTDAAINRGNSGGPLVNLRGEVIGINSAIVSQTGGFMGIGFAIPINIAKKVRDQLIATGKVVRAWLGVYIDNVTPEMAEKFNLDEPEGVIIAGVLPGSPAEKAKLKPNDIILKLDGKRVRSVGSLRNRIAWRKPGSKVVLEILRDSKKRKITVTLTKRPDDLSVAQAGGTEQPLKKYGITVQNLTPELAESLGYKVGQGVLITDVEVGSIAQEKGLRRDMLILEVNRKEVPNVKKLAAAAKTKKGGSLLLRVTDGKLPRYVILSED